MSYPSYKKTNLSAGPYKPFATSNSGVYSCSSDDARLRLLESRLNAKVPGVTRPGTELGKSPESAKRSTIDQASNVQKILSIGYDYNKLIRDSTAVSENIQLLTEKSSRLVTVTHTVRIRELTQLAVFVDETTIMLITRLRVFQQTVRFSNIDEVTRSLSELSGLLDSRLKRFGALLAQVLEAVGRASAAVTGSSKIKAVQTQLALYVSKIPRLQTALLRGMSMIGKALAALGIAISAIQTYDKWKDYSEDRSPEKLKKAIIESIAFVVGIVVIIVGAVFGGTVAIVIGAVLLIYGIVEAYLSYRDPNHQDSLSRGIYAVGEVLYAKMNTAMEMLSRLGEAFDNGIQRLGHYLYDLYQKLMQAVDRLTDSVEKKATELIDDLLLQMRDTLPHLPYP
ncbi:hypothetical protein DYU11_09020 [Fibrisoma montanum]|uniref:Uncharacterized protein n=1 Tax=Fibrisoma montanum TaxID=2305895 RepID=A0A418MF39_9BACT|nr:hypothetical protein [Fibrisoma montanum]RIV25429.1 hypothetical protein DYU11_09020 [Fibrisoma montanum]